MTDIAPILTELKRIADALDNLAAAMLAPQPAADYTPAAATPGWHKWHALPNSEEGYVPGVLRGKLLNFRFRNGMTSYGMAEGMDWSDTGENWNIVEYEVTE